MDDNLQEAQELQQALQLQAKLKAKNVDPAQPGIQAIGSNGTPGEAPPPPDWLDKLKNYVGGKLSDPKAGLLQDKNTQLMLSDVAKKMAYPFQWGDRLNDLGLTMGQDNGVTVPTPFGRDRKVTVKDLQNLMGNVAGPEVIGGIGNKMFEGANAGLDLVAKRYGKEGGVSPVLKKYGIHGSEETRQAMMDELGDKLETQRTAQELGATKAGAVPDMNQSSAPAQTWLENLKKRWTVNGYVEPAQKKIIYKFQGEIDAMKAKAATPASKQLIELPYTVPTEKPVVQPTPQIYQAETPGTVETSTPKVRLDAKGKPIVNFDPGRPTGAVTVKKSPGVVVNDAADEIVPGLPPGTRMQPTLEPRMEVGQVDVPGRPGPTVTQARQMKTTAQAKTDYESGVPLDLRESFEKQKAAGLRKEVENAVGQGLGPDQGSNYSQTNDELGRILTTKERARLEAEREGRKNFFTETKAAVAHIDPKAVGLAYLAKAYNKYKSSLGYGLSGVNSVNLAPANILSNLQNPTPNQNPWSQ